MQFLHVLNLRVTTQRRFQKTNISRLRFDFSVILQNGREVLIEYQGEQHYKAGFRWKQINDTPAKFKIRQNRDRRKKRFCKKHDIPLLCIKYTKFKQIEKLVLDFIIANDPNFTMENLNV